LFHKLGELLAGNYSHEIEKFLIIDARYPYEYEGGHIDGALNLYLIEKLTEFMFRNSVELKDKNKRFVVVFHCEFSSERGPRL
jgi:M-phase inducer phosphatase 2